ncbi:amino acid adenylation enzyme/thioester reductase family protein,thioester reductase-like protein [Rivularia sp. PCC 7116]|uniref:non-ribosomal peptide synthetase n=1 Tax=Rivularia sp. PCC 7116 TaxID=373994 RepID=UPI00029F4A6C|nr:non-ribosomal peptide synthetase [Rivularia sp. PCC 7116]AFY58519.1 amino acid adenylation enzyme/thioester reductase family protein,thioester reductase-like protein [Rivularia sp. PCC 7116]
MNKPTIEGFKLSPQQKYIWSLQQIDSSLPNRVYWTVLIEGNLDFKSLEISLEKVINKYEILRTTFRCLSGMTIPLQVINDDVIPSIDYQDISSLEAEQQQEKIQLIISELNQLSLDFEQDSLLYASIITISPIRHILAISLPTLCADTTTINNLTKEISHYYAIGNQIEESLEEPLQYADIAEWQNETIEQEEAKLGIEYWQKSCDFNLFNINLPLEKINNPETDFHPQFLNWELNLDLFKNIEVLAQQYNISISTFFLTCWQILLWRITGQAEIIIGNLFYGRKYEELQSAIGLFANYLPISYDLENNLKFSDLLPCINQNIDEAEKWQEYFTTTQLERLKSNKNQLPFFSCCFEYEQQQSKYYGNETAFSIHQKLSYLERFKAKLKIVHQTNSLLAQIHYDQSLFSVTDIQSLLLQLQNLIAEVIQKPESPIDSFNILSIQQRQQLLFDFNNTDKNYPQDKCIHQLFEQQVKIQPNKIAIVFENEQLTYAQLNNRANQLARYLQKLGVKPETVVGIYLERSPLFIISLLGILKAGAAYLSLDSTLPRDSLIFRLQDADINIVITQQQLSANLSQETLQIISLDKDAEAISNEKQDNPSSEVRLNNLVYLLFTSGSTGKPKAVAVEHQQLLNYYYAVTQKLNLERCHSFATVSTFSADLGNTIIFPALASGACLHIISQPTASHPEAFAEYFARHSIDCLKIVPTHLKALLTSSHPEQILPKQCLILGGEVSSWKLIEQLQSFARNCQIFNHYGPTETTVGASVYQVDSKLYSDNQKSKTVPIGRPLPNIKIYLLDTNLQPVPVGTPGELYIGGAGVTRGYFNRPELTNKKFISNPFLLSEKLYKTGDIARYLSNGNIEFIGRVDHQVKIHGYRIELGEIETTLLKHPAIKETVVIAKEDKSGNKRLIAYTVADFTRTVTTDDLRHFLQQHLPEYMVPNTFVQMQALPLTPNGKINRAALPNPTTQGLSSTTFVAPRNLVEEKLTELWVQILGVNQVGINDNFFELGGDSILSMQIIAKANQAGLQITPKQLFEKPTIAELALLLEQTQTNYVINAEQGLVTGEVPLTPIQNWFFEQNFANSHHWNQSFLFQVKQTLNPVILEQALQHIIEQHDALRLRFDYNESGWQQINTLPSETIPFTRINLSSKTPDEQTAEISVAATKLQKSLNLSDGPLIRVALFNLGAEQPSRLLIAIHHLVVDGVSWRILLSDFQQVYQQLTQGEVVKLPAKTTSFKKWAEKLKEYARSPKLQKELEYWQNSSQTQLTSLPVDFSNGKNTIAEAETISVKLSAIDTQELLQKVPAIYQTQINDVLLTALLQAFNQWTGKQTLTIDLEGHGREELFPDANLSRTVGWFTTVFPVLLETEDRSQTEDILLAVKKKLRSIPERGIGYGLLRYMSDSQLKLHSHTGEVKFNYLGQFDQQQAESSLFTPAAESKGISRSLQGNRSHLIDINGIVTNGELKLDWTYSKAIHCQQTIENLANSFIEKLQEIISCCQSKYIPESTTQTEIIQTLNTKATLDSSIHPDSTRFEYSTNFQHIFLTGSTGFLGAFLLYELLQNKQANVYCLVRVTNQEPAKNKLINNLKKYLLWQESFNDRIIPIVGDLSQPYLGLTKAEFQELADKLDIIYHNGAVTNLVYPYSMLEASNVGGTQEVLRLASQIKLKPVHYISTLSVLTSTEHSQITKISQLDKFKYSKVPTGGYPQTKWVSEKLISQAHSRGMPVSIYRLGRVSGDSKNGVTNINDRLIRMIRGFIQLECFPEVNSIVDMTPVDYIAKAIVYLSQQEKSKSLNHIFHLSNPQPINSAKLFEWIRNEGYPLQKMSSKQWQAKLHNLSEISTDNPLYPLIPFFIDKEKNTSKNIDLLDSLNSSHAPDNFNNTLNQLVSTSITCAVADEKLLSTYFSWLIDNGFLDAPQQLINH